MVPTSPGSPTTREKEDEFVTTWTASTDPFDPSSSLTYDLLQAWAGTLFTAKYSVLGTQYEGGFISAVRAVDLAGNRSAPASTTLV
jgi:hypothetical protein